MNLLQSLENILPILLYIAGFALLIVLIIFIIKLIKITNKLDILLDNVDIKVKSLNGIFNVIDFCTDKISSITDKIVDKITKFVISIGKRKYNKKEEDEDYE